MENVNTQDIEEIQWILEDNEEALAKHTKNGNEKMIKCYNAIIPVGRAFLERVKNTPKMSTPLAWSVMMEEASKHPEFRATMSTPMDWNTMLEESAKLPYPPEFRTTMSELNKAESEKIVEWMKKSLAEQEENPQKTTSLDGTFILFGPSTFAKTVFKEEESMDCKVEWDEKQPDTGFGAGECG